MSKTVVVKLGGNAVDEGASLQDLAVQILALREADHHIVVMHGWGPQVSAALRDHGVDTTFVAGLRVTSAEAIDVIRHSVAVAIRSSIAEELEEVMPGVTLSVAAEDIGLFSAVPHQPVIQGEPVDVGLVGTITSVDAAFIRKALARGQVPIISSLATDADGVIYNVNADIAAGSLAAALKADELVMLTDVSGLYADWPTCQQLIDELDIDTATAMLPALSAGMIPKVQACLDAVSGGAKCARILDGRRLGVVRQALIDGSNPGTKVVRNDERQMVGSVAAGDDGDVRVAEADAFAR